MKVTRHENTAPRTATPPSAEVVKTNETASEKDARGRVIEVARLNALKYYRLTKAMGASASNTAAMELAAIACSVKAINGEAVEFPVTESQVEFLIQRLDFDGISAAGAALAKLGETDGAVETAKN